MATPYEIPLSPQPQTLNIQLAGVGYILRVVFNEASQCWSIDISDAENNPIVHGIPMVTGVDLLGQYEYLGIGGALVAQTDYAADAVPTFENLGLTGRLYFVTE